MIDAMNALKQSSLFNHLSDSLLHFFAASAEERSFHANDVIFVEMSEGDEIYLIVEGKVTVQLVAANEDSNFDIITLGPGEVIGEMSFIEEGPRSTTVIAESNAILLSWKASAWRNICEKDPAIGYPLVLSVAKILCQRLRRMNQSVYDSALWGFL